MVRRKFEMLGLIWIQTVDTSGEIVNSVIRIDSDQGRQNVWPVLDANFLTRCIVFLKKDFETTMLLGHQRIICVKSFQNRTSGLREDDFFYISIYKPM